MYTNRLNTESSPYLLLHAHNPVNWFPWCNEAFSRASNENKLVIISIGYSACHWCHVMEHETFMDQEAAEIMNKSFISVKVDREERPDIDSIYMNAIQLIQGQGGWPLNVFALPDGKPVFAVTYLPKPNWISLLNQLQHLYETESDRLISQAKEIAEGIVSLNFQFTQENTKTEVTSEQIVQSGNNILKIIDFQNGGLNSVPKFPMPCVFEYLLNLYFHTKQKTYLNAVILTLDKMDMGGIYDQIGGGFARYSTDSFWKVPHFEKMLYDNAMLLSLYAKAFKITSDRNYSAIIKETIEFTMREMRSEEGGFYSTIDADSEGKEGNFYLWEYSALNNLLEENEKNFLSYFSIKPNGNWEEGKNIMHRTLSEREFCRQTEISQDDFQTRLKNVKRKLLEERNKRISPLTDTKIITSWNALMAKGLLDAYTALGDDDYLKVAKECVHFILHKLVKDDILYRNYKDGKTYNLAKLDDYANLIGALISLYQNTYDEYWLEQAGSLTTYTIKHFYSFENGLFYYSSDTDEKLIARPFEVHDNVMPSANSVMAENLLLLGHILENYQFIAISEKLLNIMRPSIIDNIVYHANWASIQLLTFAGPFEVAVTGPACVEKTKALTKHFLPNSIFLGGTKESNLTLLQHKFSGTQTNIYVCRNKVCNFPSSDPDIALHYIIENSGF
jgi:uncharacterized protein